MTTPKPNPNDMRTWDWSQRKAWRKAVQSKFGPKGAAMRGVLLGLWSFSRPTSYCDPTPIAWPKQDKIALRAGCGVRSVQKYTRMAEQNGWLDTELVKDTDGKKYGHKKYWLRIPSELHAQLAGSLGDNSDEPKPSASSAEPPATDDTSGRTTELNRSRDLRTSSYLRDLMKNLRTGDTRTSVPLSGGNKAEEQEASEEWITKTAKRLETNTLDDLMRDSIKAHGLEACKRAFYDLFVKEGKWPQPDEFAAALRAIPTGRTA